MNKYCKGRIKYSSRGSAMRTRSETKMGKEKGLIKRCLICNSFHIFYL